MSDTSAGINSARFWCSVFLLACNSYCALACFWLCLCLFVTNGTWNVLPIETHARDSPSRLTRSLCCMHKQVKFTFPCGFLLRLSWRLAPCSASRCIEPIGYSTVSSSILLCVHCSCTNQYPDSELKSGAKLFLFRKTYCSLPQVRVEVNGGVPHPGKNSTRHTQASILHQFEWCVSIFSSCLQQQCAPFLRTFVIPVFNQAHNPISPYLVEGWRNWLQQRAKAPQDCQRTRQHMGVSACVGIPQPRQRVLTSPAG